ncbi:MarR family winged helix-turn-helix transcriptional regulator [Phenylobacterium deserti]|uniref:MarR family transcriptional regulator n=1 Tax=Phenylobacterium deserti TaxID=1914756 RepID=A0A328APB1_9CAUL|nr:MarR family transcriptional regulator [Phenylobacterium deserti]RAK56790.1 MarR family transcriptional regulator [Phenylobacterium deserti]
MFEAEPAPRLSRGAGRPEGLPPYPELCLDSQLCLALQVSDSLITRIYRNLLKPLDLTHPQYLVLLVLWERGRCTMGDLREALHMDTGAITPLVKRMESGGLLKRTRDTQDERRVWVDLSERGWELRDQVAEIRREVGRRIPLTGEELAELRSTLQVLNAAMLRAAPVESDPA